MEISIKCEVKEIATLVLTLQERQNGKFTKQDLASKISEMFISQFAPKASCDNAQAKF